MLFKRRQYEEVRLAERPAIIKRPSLGRGYVLLETRNARYLIAHNELGEPSVVGREESKPACRESGFSLFITPYSQLPPDERTALDALLARCHYRAPAKQERAEDAHC